MTRWIVGESYQHKLSGVKIRMIGWTTDGRPVVERHEQPFDQYTCYDLAKCAIGFYDKVISESKTCLVVCAACYQQGFCHDWGGSIAR